MEVKISNLIKSYNNRMVLDISNLTFEHNRFYGIVGPNGAGKSTLLKMISGFEKEYEGHITYDGQAYQKQVQKHMTYMNQKHYMMRTSVYNNIAYPLKLRHLSKTVIEDKVNRMMKELGLYELRDQLAINLSGGEAQKVALARAMIFEPSLLLLDEPTANIDPKSLSLIEDVIMRWHKEAKGTTVMVTHNVTQAKSMSDEVILLDDGRIGSMDQGMAFIEQI